MTIWIGIKLNLVKKRGEYGSLKVSMDRHNEGERGSKRLRLLKRKNFSDGKTPGICGWRNHSMS